MTVVALTGHEFWTIALIIGLVAALVVAGLLAALLLNVARIQRSVEGLLETAGKVGANTANIPQLEATAPGAGADRRRGRGAGRLHERAHRRVRQGRAEEAGVSTDAYIVLSVVLAVVVIAVLAVALIRVRRGLTAISAGLATLSDALEGVEAEHLRPLEPAVKAINAQFEIILARPAGNRAQGGDRRRAEAAMTLWWIGSIVLLVVVAPGGRLSAARRARIRPLASSRASSGSRPRRRPGSKDLDAAALLVTTRDQVEQTVAGRRGLRRLARRDRRRRRRGEGLDAGGAAW